MREEVLYLSQVLGLQDFLSENNAAIDASVATAVAAATAAVTVAPSNVVTMSAFDFYIYTPFALAEREQELVDKMVKAIGVETARFLNQSDNSEVSFANAANSKSRRYGLSFGVVAPADWDIVWLQLPAISHFMNDTDAAKVTAVKKKTWAELKEFKSKMES